MGWIAFVESDTGEIISVIRPDGLAGGKALLSFLTIAESGCNKNSLAEDDVIAWIKDFNEKSENKFCDVVETLNNVYYSGDWNYQEDEYNFFLHRSPDSEISEIEFKRVISEIREMWVDVDKLIRSIEVLADEFRKGYLKETDWYVEQDTIGDFEGLLNSLFLAKDRNAKEVRIRID